MNKDARAIELASRQGGVLRADQALACGFSYGAIAYRVAQDRWARLARGIYRLIDLRQPIDRVRAAVATLPGAVVSHETAAEIQAIPSLRSGLAVVTVHTQTTHKFLDIIVHRCHDMEDEHIVEIDGLPVTTIERTVVDMAAFLKPGHTAAILDDLISQKKITFESFARVALQVARRGRPGSAALRQIIEERSDEAANASRLEREGLALLRAAGVPKPMIEYPIPWNRFRRFDVAFPDHKVAIEWDSRRWHTTAEAFELDRHRDRDAVLHGWRVLRFTWKDVMERSGEVIRTVRHVVLGDRPALEA